MCPQARQYSSFYRDRSTSLLEGVIVALGSDFNPNAYCLAMPMIMHL
ncbi:hypothetical protein COOONC_05438, partial [Cooperia oncophora]